MSQAGCWGGPETFLVLPRIELQGQPERSSLMGTEGARHTHTALWKVVADALVCTDGMDCFLHVGPGHLTWGADVVGAADPPSQKHDGGLDNVSVWDPQPHLRKMGDGGMYQLGES